MTIDLRSDTITRPSKAMIDFMAGAPVGDDVFREDPSVNELERYTSELLGYEAALYCGSGTLANQIAIMAHTRPGDEVICSDLSHIYLYEGGGIAANAGCSVRLIHGDRGRITAAQIEANINADDVHFPGSTLVSIEDTMNKGGGAVYNPEEVNKIRTLCHQRGLKFHCDGARIFNSLVVRGAEASSLSGVYDSLSVCLSKGLGAPVGSVLLGTEEFIRNARRIRKRLGGGMRQAGIVASAGLYAIQNNVERLSDDHRRAKELETLLMSQSWVKSVLPVETNIVILELADGFNSQMVLSAFKEQNILALAFGNDKIRLVTHLDFTEEHLVEIRSRFNNLQFNMDTKFSKEGIY